MKTCELELPWPDRILSPNVKAHWAVKAKAFKKYKTDCYYTAKSKPIPMFEKERIQTLIIFHPPSKRHFDSDNLHSRMKSGLDGICLAWGIDDKRFKPVTIDIQEPVVHGKVRLIYVL